MTDKRRVAVFCEGGPSGVGRAAKSDFSPLSEHQGIFYVNDDDTLEKHFQINHLHTQILLHATKVT